MSWSAAEEANSAAGAFDVRLRFYAGPRYRNLDLSAFTAGELPAGWTSADEPGEGWTEITDRVRHAGSLSYERAGAAVRWRAELTGEDFDAALLGQGRAILCLREIWREGVSLLTEAGEMLLTEAGEDLLDG
jgi:hypothetical protein